MYKKTASIDLANLDFVFGVMCIFSSFRNSNGSTVSKVRRPRCFSLYVILFSGILAFLNGLDGALAAREVNFLCSTVRAVKRY